MRELFHDLRTNSNLLGAKEKSYSSSPFLPGFTENFPYSSQELLNFVYSDTLNAVMKSLFIVMPLLGIG